MMPGPFGGPGGFMAGKAFAQMRKRVLHEHKHLIVRSAKNGHKTKGRGMVLVKFTQTGRVHLSYLTLDELKHQRSHAVSEAGERRDILIEKVSSYSPDSEIPVMITDGETQRFSLGIRQAAPLQPAP
jgi:hypothetical protein